jgi:hypothetical protein
MLPLSVYIYTDPTYSIQPKLFDFTTLQEDPLEFVMKVVEQKINVHVGAV